MQIPKQPTTDSDAEWREYWMAMFNIAIKHTYELAAEGPHASDCRIFHVRKGSCDCGWDELRNIASF